jgi:penicillin-binding protein 2
VVRFRPKKQLNFDAEEILFEAESRKLTELSDYSNQYETRLGAIHTFLPLLAVLIVGILFGGRMYALQNDSDRGLANQADSNLYRVSAIVADRGEVTDRNNVPLIWNSKTPGAEFSDRNYIETPGFNHILGFISPPLKDDNDNFSRASYVARSGVEKVYDPMLQGDNGAIIAETTAEMDASSGSKIEESLRGADLALSIDSIVQEELYNSIKSLADKVGFKRGSGGIMDIKTGEVIALTNFPEYSRDFNDQSGDEAYLNLFTHGLFTPGSIVKPFMALAALEESIISPDREILSTKTIVIPNPYNPSRPTYFSDWKAHGYVDVRDALALSSNAYFYAIGGGLYDQEGIGISQINKYMTAFGLGEPAGIAGFEEVGGVVPSPEWKKQTYPNDQTWRLGDTFLTSIGQYGWQVTPLQMLRSVAAIANRGILVQPTLKLDGEQINTKVPIKIDDSNYQIVHEGMRQAVESGTARGLNVPYLNIAGKTGTAELGVSKANVNSWVMGFWPYEEPRYAFVVMMNEGSRYNLTGATFVMRQLFDSLNTMDSTYVTQFSQIVQ